MNRYILLVLHIVSLLLLALGWVKDMLHIEVSTHFIVDFNLFSEKRSVLGTLQTLWEGANYWPFFLIFLFGIVVPVVKSFMIFYVLLIKNSPAWAYTFINSISKWAMADVFAISIFVAFLGARAMQNTKAALEPGFYFFSAYVLISAVVSTILGKMLKNTAAMNV